MRGHIDCKAQQRLKVGLGSCQRKQDEAGTVLFVQPDINREKAAQSRSVTSIFRCSLRDLDGFDEPLVYNPTGLAGLASTMTALRFRWWHYRSVGPS